MESTSATLLDQLRGRAQGDAWARFVHLYTPLLVHWADRLGVARSDRADLVQEVFLVVLRTLPEFAYDPARSFRGWLYTVTVNKLRELKRKRVPEPIPDPGERVEEDDPVAAVDEAEYRAILVTRATELIRLEFTPATWQAFWATVTEGRPAAEVAAELGLTPNAVYLARARVLTRLRSELAGLLE